MLREMGPESGTRSATDSLWVGWDPDMAQLLVLES